MCCPDLREAVTRLRIAEVNAVAGVLKLYFRELPEPLIPTEMFQRLAKTLGKDKCCHSCGRLLTKQSQSKSTRPASPSDVQDLNSRLVSMLSLLQCCPDASRHTFLYLMRHLQRSDPDTNYIQQSQLGLMSLAYFNTFLQGVWEAGRQQNVSAEPGYSVWAQPHTPPYGQTGTGFPFHRYFPGGGGPGEDKAALLTTATKKCLVLQPKFPYLTNNLWADTNSTADLRVLGILCRIFKFKYRPVSFTTDNI